MHIECSGDMDGFNKVLTVEPNNAITLRTRGDVYRERHHQK